MATHGCRAGLATVGRLPVNFSLRESRVPPWPAVGFSPLATLAVAIMQQAKVVGATGDGIAGQPKVAGTNNKPSARRQTSPPSLIDVRRVEGEIAHPTPPMALLYSMMARAAEEISTHTTRRTVAVESCAARGRWKVVGQFQPICGRCGSNRCRGVAVRHTWPRRRPELHS